MADGSLSQLGWGFESALGLKSATPYFMQVNNFSHRPGRPLTRTDNMHPRGMLLRSRNLQADVPWSFEGKLSVDDIVRWRLHQQGFATISNLTGAYSWALRDKLAADVLANYIETVWFEADQDDEYAHLVLTGAATETSIKVEMNKEVSVKVSGLGLRDTHLSDATVTPGVGETYTGKMLARGHRSDPSSTDTISVKVTTAGALNGAGAKVKIKRGAGAYGTTDYFVTAGVWFDAIIDDNSTHASGDPLDPLQFVLTGLTSDTVALNTEWVFSAKRTKAAASYPTKNPLTALGALIKVAGTTYPVDSCEIKHVTPKKVKFGTGSKWGYRILRNGDRQWTVSLQRDYTDRALYELLCRGVSATFDCDMYGDFIGATTHRERWRMYMPAVKIAEAGPDSVKAGQLSEKVELVAEFDGTNPDCSETVVCGISTLV